MNQNPAIYRADGVSTSWPIPFSYAGAEEVAVSLTAPDGVERRLARGTDYIVRGDNVICIAAAGYQISIWRECAAAVDGAVNTAISGMGEQINALADEEAGAALARIGEQINARADEEAGAAVARVSGAISVKADEVVDSAEKRIMDASQRAINDADASINIALKKAVNAAALYGQTTARCGVLHQTVQLAAGAYVELPDGMAYFPGRSSLQVYKNGVMLAPGADYEETGRENEPSTLIRQLSPSYPNDVWTFWNLPSTSAATAETAALNASQSANAAAGHALDAREAAQSIAEANNTLCQCSGNAEHFAGEAEKQAINAHKQAITAWRYAVSASVHNSRPGISVLKSLEEKTCMSTGFFIINPHITHSPTPFMGLWPVEKLEDMKWDGVFLIGPQYPECPKMPPKCPPPPDVQWPNPDTSGDADDWLPDNHKHNNAGGTVCSACFGNCNK